MENTECTMEDIVNMVNNSEGEFVIHVEFEKREDYGEQHESI